VLRVNRGRRIASLTAATSAAVDTQGSRLRLTDSIRIVSERADQVSDVRLELRGSVLELVDSAVYVSSCSATEAIRIIAMH